MYDSREQCALTYSKFRMEKVYFHSKFRMEKEVHSKFRMEVTHDDTQIKQTPEAST